jgi:hypothetical protein
VTGVGAEVTGVGAEVTGVGAELVEGSDDLVAQAERDDRVPRGQAPGPAGLLWGGRARSALLEEKARKLSIGRNQTISSHIGTYLTGSGASSTVV